jgi:Na+/citrate or Na+/malate symporter
MSLCKYKAILGESGVGIHSYRIFDIAIIDLLLTIIVAYYISDNPSEFYSNFTLLFILGIILHRIFCVNTTINKYIFGVV